MTSDDPGLIAFRELAFCCRELHHPRLWPSNGNELQPFFLPRGVGGPRLPAFIRDFSKDCAVRGRVPSEAFVAATSHFIFLKILFIIFREGEKHQYVVASHTPPTGDLAHNPDMCPDWESNSLSFGSQASSPSTEPHQPGLHFNWDSLNPLFSFSHSVEVLFPRELFHKLSHPKLQFRAWSLESST